MISQKLSELRSLKRLSLSQKNNFTGDFFTIKLLNDQFFEQLMALKW